MGQHGLRTQGSRLTVCLLAGLGLPASVAGGTPTFSDQTAAAGVDMPTVCGSPAKRHILEANGSGAAFVDVDADGHLDLYLVNGSTAETLGAGPGNALFRNRGNGTFTNGATDAGVDDAGWGGGVAVGDIDGVSDLDLYVTNFGANVLYRNDGTGQFTDISVRTGTAGRDYSARAAFFVRSIKASMSVLGIGR